MEQYALSLYERMHRVESKKQRVSKANLLLLYDTSTRKHQRVRNFMRLFLLNLKSRAVTIGTLRVVLPHIPSNFLAYYANNVSHPPPIAIKPLVSNNTAYDFVLLLKKIIHAEVDGVEAREILLKGTRDSALQVAVAHVLFALLETIFDLAVRRTSKKNLEALAKRFGVERSVKSMNKDKLRVHIASKMVQANTMRVDLKKKNK